MLTASIKLNTSKEQFEKLLLLQQEYSIACNKIVKFVIKNRCWNRVDLHKFTYNFIRENTALGSQMVCNAIYSVCKSYKSQKELGRIKKGKELPILKCNKSSIHFDKRTYSIKDNYISLYILQGRIKVEMLLGKHQQKILSSGKLKEAELIIRNNICFCNVVVENETKEYIKLEQKKIIGIDIGENNLAASSIGSIWGGANLRHTRDKYLSLRCRLQSNGSQSAKQKLRQISGKEQRRVKHLNHQISKQIIDEALYNKASQINLEDLTNIRANIKAGKRVKTRLHRWAFRQLQTFIEYKAKNVGIEIKYINPAYTSKTCSQCNDLGNRIKHKFSCRCGFLAHADLNASLNIAKIGILTSLPKADVNLPNVGASSLQ